MEYAKSKREVEAWNEAIFAALRAIMICRKGFPGPYYGDVEQLLICDWEDQEWRQKVKDFEDAVIKEMETK